MLSHREEILQSWIAAVDGHPVICASESLTYRKLVDHLQELCSELVVLLKRPGAEGINGELGRKAKALAWKAWRRGYKLDELILEICLVRRDFIGTWLHAFAAANPRFNTDAQNGARRIVERFFDNVIIEVTSNPPFSPT